MGNLFGPVDTFDVIYAAIAAFAATYLITRFLRIRDIMKRNELSVGYREIDIRAVMEKCTAMFPNDTLYFKGSSFKRGMRIRITTMKKRIIEGELIGCNSMNMLCIITPQHIIAHEINKIEEIQILGD